MGAGASILNLSDAEVHADEIEAPEGPPPDTNAALSELCWRVQDAGHGVRGPQSMVIGLIDLVLSRGDVPREAREQLVFARQAALKTLRIVHNLNGQAACIKYGSGWESRIQPYARWVYGLPPA
jgi:hypothetical protein